MTIIASGVLPSGPHWYRHGPVCGYAGTLVTIDGRYDNGGPYIHATAELADPTPEAITALADRLIADSRARRAGKRVPPLDLPERRPEPVPKHESAPTAASPVQGELL